MWFAWVSEVTRAIWKEELPHIYTIVSSSESENCVERKIGSGMEGMPQYGAYRAEKN